MKAPGVSKKSRRVDAGDQRRADTAVRQLRPSTMIHRSSTMIQRLPKPTERKMAGEKESIRQLRPSTMIQRLPKPAERKMEGEEESINFPEGLVEKIVAMMPFPSIFKARGLSKSWQAKFEAISAQDDEAKKYLAMSFHKQVRQWSNKWGSFCHICETEEWGLIGFDRTFQNWVRLPSFSFLPDDFLQLLSCTEFMLRMEGPLMYGYAKGLHVANVLTRKCKELPTPFDADLYIDDSMKLVINETASQSYKMIAFCVDDRLGKFWAHIYDSKSETWTSSLFNLPNSYNPQFGPFPYLNGVFHILTDFSLQNLLTFNLEERTWKGFRWSTWVGFPVGVRTSCTTLADCDGNLLMIENGRRILQIDLESQRFLEVACSYSFELIKIPVNEGKRIFFICNEHGQLVCMLEYDPQKDAWSSFSMAADRWLSNSLDNVPCHSVSFQPGLNPFMEL